MEVRLAEQLSSEKMESEAWDAKSITYDKIRLVVRSWTKVFVFHFTQTGKAWIDVFSLQLWVNSRTECFFLSLVRH